MLSSVDTIWVLIATALIFFMQAGFAMVETGFTRAKNAGNIIMKNLIDFAIGTPAFWLIGFGIMFAGSGPFIGGLDFMVQGDYNSTIPTAAFLIFQTFFVQLPRRLFPGLWLNAPSFQPTVFTAWS